MGSLIGGIFGNPKQSKPVPPPATPEPVAPTPTPEELNSDAAQRDRDRRRQKIAQAGRGGTILTQGQTLASGQGSILGRSNA